MSDRDVPEPPSISGLEPRMMTTKEIRQKLEELFSWLRLAEDSPGHDERDLQAVRDAANSLLRERRLRHADEPGPRGG